MCIQVVTQVFAELWKDNHHANFQLINDKNTYRKQIPISHHYSFFFSACMQKILQYDYSLWCILGCTIVPGYSWAYNHSWIFLGVQLFLDIPGRTIIPGSGKIIKFWFCGFIFVGLFSIFLMQVMELTVHSK